MRADIFPGGTETADLAMEVDVPLFDEEIEDGGRVSTLPEEETLLPGTASLGGGREIVLPVEDVRDGGRDGGTKRVFFVGAASPFKSADSCSPIDKHNLL